MTFTSNKKGCISTNDLFPSPRPQFHEIPPPPPAYPDALVSRRGIKYKSTRYYLERLQMACLERCIKWSWNLILGEEKENFPPLILS